MRLTGVGVGSTTMLVWNKDGSDRLAYLITVSADVGDGAK
ncbi:MAG: pilus assembly protein N-terminal domain-containing protein [Myxococcales bacterium]